MSSLPDLYSGLFPRDAGSLQCQTARAANYYGLGTRLGIYFAWANAYVANTLHPAQIAGAADTNSIFLLAILIAIIKCSSIRMLEAIDGLVLMHLSGGFLFGTFSLWGYRTRRYVDDGPAQAVRCFGGFATHARLLISLMISVYGLWFWLYGVVGGLVTMGSPEEVGELAVDPPNSRECEALYTFMFAKVRADGGIRIFYIIVCIGCILYYGIMTLASGIAGWARARKVFRLYKEKQWAESSRLKFATGFKYRELEVIFKYLRVLNLIWLIYSMLLVEFTLNFNHVTAVLGGPHDNELHLPSGLLPLLIGALSFVRTCYLFFQTKRSPEDINPSLSTASSPVPARKIRSSRDLLLAFSPAMARKSTWSAHDPEEVDEALKKRGRPVRYLVAWLPWLSLLEPFRESRPVSEKGKRLSERSGWSENSDRTLFGEEGEPGGVPRNSGNVELKRKPVPNRQGNDDHTIPAQAYETV